MHPRPSSGSTLQLSVLFVVLSPSSFRARDCVCVTYTIERFKQDMYYSVVASICCKLSRIPRSKPRVRSRVLLESNADIRSFASKVNSTDTDCIKVVFLGF